MNREQVIADLQATKARMTPENWCGSGWEDEIKGRKCVLHHLSDAIKEVIPSSSLRWVQANDALAMHLPTFNHGGYGRNVGVYNDSSDTTYRDIEMLIDKTLADLGGLA